MSDVADEMLLEKVKTGDRGAFDALYEKYKRPIMTYAMRLIGNRETAEEVAQETFLKVYLHAAQFSPRGKVSSWIYTIASNLAKNALRDRRYFRDLSLEMVLKESEAAARLWQIIADTRPGPEADLAAKELDEAIQKVLATMPPRFREVLILCDLQGLPYEEVGRIIGSSIGTVASRLSRARQLFMKRFGGRPPL